jgi:hypothetical protein
MGITRPREAMIALVLVVALVVLGLAYSGPIQDQWRCRFRLHHNIPYGSIWIRVPERKQQELIRYVKNFAHERGLMFGTLVFDVGTTSIEHKQVAIDTCNRVIDVGISNVAKPEIFGIHASRNPGYSMQRFQDIYQDFIQGIDARFERVSDEERRAAGIVIPSDVTTD